MSAFSDLFELVRYGRSESRPAPDRERSLPGPGADPATLAA